MLVHTLTIIFLPLKTLATFKRLDLRNGMRLVSSRHARGDSNAASDEKFTRGSPGVQALSMELD